MCSKVEKMILHTIYNSGYSHCHGIPVNRAVYKLQCKTWKMHTK